MPSKALNAAASSIFNFTSLLSSLPTAARPQALSRCSACLFSTSPVLETIAKKKKRKVNRYVDPYRAAQARQRKAANIARQETLKKERQEAMGDPVRSTNTPFIASLSTRSLQSDIAASHLNFFVTPAEMEKSVEFSRWLTEPLPHENPNATDPPAEERRKKKHDDQHVNAEKALKAIAGLENSSSGDRTRLNIQRCIEEFGRHNTDAILPPKPASLQTAIIEHEDAAPRAGRDTGSSEVQAAILTAKINVLADNLHKKDKHNKRNLRVMVHKRQKLLSYLRRKERGGPRWQHLVEKLGIGDAMWKGEISL